MTSFGCGVKPSGTLQQLLVQLAQRLGRDRGRVAAPWRGSRAARGDASAARAIRGVLLLQLAGFDVPLRISVDVVGA